MQKHPKNQSYAGSSGQTLTANVSMTLRDWQFVTKPMSYVAALHLVPNQIRYRINMVPTSAVAWTRA